MAGKKGNPQDLVPRERGRPKFSKSPFSLRTKVAGAKRGGLVKGIFANLKRLRRV